ncbi:MULTISPECIES: NAD(P)H-quinone oxidoreductase [Nocardiaceae]|uniref:PIG3 family NAD(P)H quinone oxidoreductase n=1 Tax=Rhodococcoides corynebacterioides TaxID=53972 RepID=A0ABS2KY13_9NOCA|nr:MULTISPECIES: NAD(P)H-quinone oxidoreductase [Rhodococcus]MBM7416822.1 putative PIG3 family NAD(P)H quinone oxidoreductase [Rhodococcus corynebacterioides]MBP1115075.1 putative PIG3 family NAD(P)H quinone oxidoreductase [Rhodococcus sp. PvP016]
MYAITLTEYGDPEVMVWTEVPDPVPGPGEVLISVSASAVNRADLQQRQGNYPPPAGASDVLGLECSGVIADVGADVTSWKVGDRVCALLAGGGYAEQVVVPAGQVLPVPDGLDLHVAASLPEVACTVWSNVVMYAGLSAGDTLLVHGGGSGIGTHAIQVAKALGARVAVTAGSAEKLEICRSFGADILIDYKTTDFVEEIRTATDGHGADVVLDNMGAKYLARNISALAMDGRLVTIGMQGGRVAEFDFGALMAKRGTVHCAGLRARPLTGPGGKADIVRQVREHVWPMIADGAVVPVVHAEVPVTDASQAHRMLDDHATVGKVILRVR